MPFRLIPAIIIGIMLSIVASKIVYFGFTPNYAFSTRVIPNAFHSQFDNDVFKYRVLSKSLLLALDNFLTPYFSNKKPDPVTMFPSYGSYHFYYAYFYLNTFFLCLTSIMLVLLLRLNSVFLLTNGEKYSFLVLSIVLINLSQFALYYYDVSSYFFQLLVLYLYLRYYDKERVAALVSICGVIFISTMNRESSALSVSILTLLVLQQYGINKKSLLDVLLIAASFLVTYYYLRYSLSVSDDIKYRYRDDGHWLYEINVYGELFWMICFCFSLFMANQGENRLMIVAFHFLSLPYIIVCLHVVMWEVRLYIPLLLGSLLLGKLNTSQFKFQLSSWLPTRLYRR